MKKAVFSAVSAVIVLTSTACSSLDVIQKDAVRAFDEILKVYQISADSEVYRLEAPDGEASFIWSPQEVSMSVAAAPFVAAGLDFSKLDPAVYNGDEDVFFMQTGMFNMLNQNVKDTAIDQFAEDLGYKRKDLGFHAALGHYNISLGNGNMFEWAKDMSATDKDIVFVLDPAPFIAAGVDVSAIDGWTFAKVTVDIDGKPTEVDKLLKPFDIR